MKKFLLTLGLIGSLVGFGSLAKAQSCQVEAYEYNAVVRSPYYTNIQTASNFKGNLKNEFIKAMQGEKISKDEREDLKKALGVADSFIDAVNINMVSKNFNKEGVELNTASTVYAFSKFSKDLDLTNNDFKEIFKNTVIIRVTKEELNSLKGNCSGCQVISKNSDKESYFVVISQSDYNKLCENKEWFKTMLKEEQKGNIIEYLDSGEDKLIEDFIYCSVYSCSKQ
jgi:hypothetical protein